MVLRNIIFDLDGTLIDSIRLTGAIIDRMLAARGAQERADRDLIRRMDAVGGEAMIAAVLGPHSSDPGREIEEFRTLHRVIDVPGDLPFPGVRDALKTLAEKGINLSICSNKPQFLCDKILSDLGLAQYFAGIIGSSPERPRKPAPEAALLALQAVGGNAANTLFCGDSSIDVNTAHAAGLRAVLVAWGYGTAEALATYPTTPVVNSMPDLIEDLDTHLTLPASVGRDVG